MAAGCGLGGAATGLSAERCAKARRHAAGWDARYREFLEAGGRVAPWTLVPWDECRAMSCCTGDDNPELMSQYACAELDGHACPEGPPR